jgi:hypothetical protein
MKKYLIEKIKALRQLFVSSRSTIEFSKWNEMQKNFNEKFIYAYQSDDGGIYKTMQLSLIGNCDAPKFVFAEHQYYYGFVRIDNQCGYCQFMYHSLEELFNHHYDSNHKMNEIYEFTNQKSFFEWCLSRPMQYPKNGY